MISESEADLPSLVASTVFKASASSKRGMSTALDTTYTFCTGFLAARKSQHYLILSRLGIAS